MIQQFKNYCKTHKTRIRRLSKEGGWIVTGQFVSALGALMLVRVLTEYLEPVEYGELALGLTIAGLVNNVMVGGVNNGIGRFYSIAVENDDLSGYLRASRCLLGYATLAIMCTAILLVNGLIATGMHRWLWLAVASMVFSILSGYNSALNGLQNAARQRAIVALHAGMNAWLKIGLAIVVMLWLGTNSTAAVMGYALSALVVTLSQLIFLKRLMARQAISHNSVSSVNWTQKMWQFSWPFSAFGVFTWAQQVSDRWALEGIGSTADVGQYAVVFQLGYTPIMIVTGLMMTLVGPILYQRTGAANDSDRNAHVHRIAWCITQVSLAVTTIVFAFTWLFHAWLFQLLVAENFRGVSYLLPWVVLAGGLFAAGQMLSLKLMSEIRSELLLKVKIITALIGVAVNVIGAIVAGIEGVVAALVVFSLIYLFWIGLLSTEIYKPVDQ